MKPASLAVGNRRLLRLAARLFTVDAQHRKRGEPTYYQNALQHRCGTPACALGHAMAWFPSLEKSGQQSHYFHIDGPESLELFGFCGCGEAKTAKQAAAYIRRFVKRRERATKAGAK